MGHKSAKKRHGQNRASLPLSPHPPESFPQSSAKPEKALLLVFHCQKCHWATCPFKEELTISRQSESPRDYTKILIFQELFCVPFFLRPKAMMGDLAAGKERSQVPDDESGRVHLTPGVWEFLHTFEAYDLVCLAFHRDTDTLVGLPRPIHESVKTLKQVTGGGFSGVGSHPSNLDYQVLVRG